ncbi:hypothetical protein WK59_11255 [Burkholderia ubonensis]|nr:hypothetical protein WK59_11255 [Burkholderia ubonensis]
MLGSEVLTINNTIVHIVFKLIPQRLKDNVKRVAFVMGQQVFHIFQQKCLWSLCGNDASDIKEKSSLRRTFKPMWPAK